MANAPGPVISIEERIKGALWGVLVADALGGPVQFKSRGSFERVTDLRYVEPYHQPLGSWSDDGSLTLCLVQSLLDTSFEYTNADFVVKLVAWLDHGYLSSAEQSWDVGAGTQAAGDIWRQVISGKQYPNAGASIAKGNVPTKAAGLEFDVLEGQRRIDERLKKPSSSGNGSLMRIAPLGLAFWDDVEKARRTAQDNSQTTHPSPRCGDACALYVELLAGAVQGLTKEQLHVTVRKAHVPGHEIRDLLSKYQHIEDWARTDASKVGSKGYVVATLEAALWGFFTTDSWEAGALVLANLGDDSDSNCAVYGALAGAFYGLEQVPQRWREKMVKKGTVEAIIDVFAGRVAGRQRV